MNVKTCRSRRVLLFESSSLDMEENLFDSCPSSSSTTAVSSPEAVSLAADWAVVSIIEPTRTFIHEAKRREPDRIRNQKMEIYEWTKTYHAIQSCGRAAFGAL
jgi:hypothetical protein